MSKTGYMNVVLSNLTNMDMFSFVNLLERLGSDIIMNTDPCPACETSDNLRFYNVGADGRIIMELNADKDHVAVICKGCGRTGNSERERFAAWKSWNAGKLA